MGCERFVRFALPRSCCEILSALLLSFVLVFGSSATRRKKVRMGRRGPSKARPSKQGSRRHDDDNLGMQPEDFVDEIDECELQSLTIRLQKHSICVAVLSRFLKP